MTLDPTLLRNLRQALSESEDLVLGFIAQTGALSKVQKEAEGKLAEAAKVRDIANAKAKADYDKVEGVAQEKRAAAEAAAATAYNAVAEVQNIALTGAQTALAEAEAALRVKQDDIKTEFGYDTNLFPSPVQGGMIRVG